MEVIAQMHLDICMVLAVVEVMVETLVYTQ